MSPLNDPELQALLDRLHRRSDEQIEAMKAYYAARTAAKDGAPLDPGQVKTFLSDKLVALDRDKAEFCYQLCRAAGVRRAVEIGTSYGVSTLYLAAAVRDNLAALGGDGVVIGTEYEADKAAAAQRCFQDAGLAALIELKVGDLRETLKTLQGPIDFLLVDIWIPMARPALDLVSPHLRPGAMVICDNTESYRADYADYFAALDDPTRGFSTMTLPFDGGLELSVYAPRA